MTGGTPERGWAPGSATARFQKAAARRPVRAWIGAELLTTLARPDQMKGAGPLRWCVALAVEHVAARLCGTTVRTLHQARDELRKRVDPGGGAQR